MTRTFSISGARLLLLVMLAGILGSSAFARTKPIFIPQKIGFVHELPSERAAKSLGIVVKGVVTSFDGANRQLFLQDETGAVFIADLPELDIHPGDVLEVRGYTESSFRTQIRASTVRKIGTAPLPRPEKSTFTDIISGKHDCRFVQLRGQVQAASVQNQGEHPYLFLEIKLPDGHAIAQVLSFTPGSEADLVGAQISITGAAAGIFDANMQIVAIRLAVDSSSQIQVLQRSSERIENLPLTPLENVMSTFSEANHSKRVRVRGVLTFRIPGEEIVLEDRGRALYISLHDQRPLEIGSIIEATGFAHDDRYSPSLRWGQVLSVVGPGKLEPKAITADEARAGRYSFRLVKMTGTVLEHVSSDKIDVVDLDSDGKLLRVIFRRDSRSSLAIVPKGAFVQVVGVCFVQRGGPWNSPESFSLHMRTPADLVILRQPSWWNVQHMLILVGWLGAVVLVTLFLLWALQRKVARQALVHQKVVEESADAAIRRGCLEAQRSKVLEAINSRIPLKEVLGLIQSFLEEAIPGSRCTIFLSDDPVPTSDTESDESGSVTNRLIVSGNGEVLGTLRLRFKQLSLGKEVLKETIDIGCNLAALAIENRRLFGDLLYRSQHDQLTGIPNRYLLEKRLKEAIDEARHSEKRVGLIYIDLDLFKSINDQYGHRTGDVYLQTVAQRLLFQLHNRGTVARVGGDEFIVVLPNMTTDAEIRQIAYELHRTFDEPVDVESVEIPGTASFGISSFPEDGETMDTLKRKADAAMYQAKSRHLASSPAVEEEKVSPLELAKALQEERFLLHYQPQCTKDGRICSVEALLRMRDESGNIIYPNDFIEVAENSELILPIGEWVLRTACLQLAEWRATTAPELVMMVNVSGLQLQSPNYATQVLGIIRETGIPASALELELTETILLENLQICLSHMEQLRQAGVRFSIDDFGTGYSSLSMVHKLPVDTIKIDRAFIQGLHHRPSSHNIIRLIMGLAEAVHVRVIAEGVEEKEELEELVADGCSYFQGFYFSRPQPVTNLEELLDQQKIASKDERSGSQAPHFDGELTQTQFKMSSEVEELPLGPVQKV